MELQPPPSWLMAAAGAGGGAMLGFTLLGDARGFAGFLAMLGGVAGVMLHEWATGGDGDGL